MSSCPSCPIIEIHPDAGVAELADARDSKSRSLHGSVGSIPSSGTSVPQRFCGFAHQPRSAAPPRSRRLSPKLSLSPSTRRVVRHRIAGRSRSRCCNARTRSASCGPPASLPRARARPRARGCAARRRRGAPYAPCQGWAAGGRARRGLATQGACLGLGLNASRKKCSSADRTYSRLTSWAFLSFAHRDAPGGRDTFRRGP